MSSNKAKKSGKVGRGDLIAGIRAAVVASGGETISLKKFVAASRFTEGDVLRNFSRWNEALEAAGIGVVRVRRVDDEILLADWGKTARKLGHPPARSEYASFGGFHVRTVKLRFGGPWVNVVAAFRNFAMKRHEWADVLAMLPEHGREGDVRKRAAVARRGTRPEREAKKLARMGDLQISGDPLYCEGISHAPVNEAGVMMLFGAMAAKLGFMVESVRSTFPDCQAKRRIGPDAWLTLRIEFEYKSRNFRDHGHPPDECDMIVCWVHNWPDCPPGLKVLALSEELARLRRESLMLAF
ncbi:MAG TPA: hypothetical protein VG733_17360 [Chthoniobacteraceae bacterium]|nr:hypothetical protein [Chthoniobacteraceae bacterium]